MSKEEAAIITAYTGIHIGDFPTFHAYIEKKLGRPIWTHELANSEIWKEIKEKTRKDFQNMEVI